MSIFIVLSVFYRPSYSSTCLYILMSDSWGEHKKTVYIIKLMCFFVWIWIRLSFEVCIFYSVTFQFSTTFLLWNNLYCMKHYKNNDDFTFEAKSWEIILLFLSTRSVKQTKWYVFSNNQWCFQRGWFPKRVAQTDTHQHLPDPWDKNYKLQD